MPTVTTTVTAAAATGAVTTVTTTEATPEPAAAAPTPAVGSAKSLVDVDTFDTSIYEIRTYYCKASVYEAGSPPGFRSTASNGEVATGSPPKYAAAGYGAWVERFFELATPTLDVAWIFWKIIGQEPSIMAGPAYPGGLVDDAFEKAHPDCPAVVCWAVRFDDKAHADASWARLFGNPVMMAHVQAHPYVQDFLRMESRFMQSLICKPQRWHNPTKVYEVRNYTLDTSTVPWTAAIRKQYADWTTALFLGEDALLSPENNQLGVKVIHFHMAQVEPQTVTVDGANLQPVDHGVTPPHVCWTVEWDSKDQADATWAAMLSDPAALDQFAQAGPGSPFWKPGKPLFGYQKMESSWMTAGSPLFFE